MSFSVCRLVIRRCVRLSDIKSILITKDTFEIDKRKELGKRCKNNRDDKTAMNMIILVIKQWTG
jgi:hypothetical protein